MLKGTKKVQLGLIVRDVEYARRMADYVRSGPFRDACQLVAFTNAEACRQYVSQGFGLELLVGEPELLAEIKPAMGAVRMVGLVNRLGESGLEEEALRFQALPRLLNVLLSREGSREHQAKEAGANAYGEDGEAMVIGVGSASGGVGVTALALHLAHGASELGLSACYLNLERWNSAGSWLGKSKKAEEGNQGLSELLYAIKAHGKAEKEWLNANRQYDARLKADYLSGFSHPEDRESLSGEDAVALIDYLADSERYQMIVVDLDNGLADLQVKVLERCQSSFFVVTEDAASVAKLLQAGQFGSHKWGDRYNRAIANNWVVRNKCSGGAAAPLPPECRAAPGSLPDVAVWRAGKSGKLLDSPPFRAASAELLKLALKKGGRVRVPG